MVPQPIQLPTKQIQTRFNTFPVMACLTSGMSPAAYVYGIHDQHPGSQRTLNLGGFLSHRATDNARYFLFRNFFLYDWRERNLKEPPIALLLHGSYCLSTYSKGTHSKSGQQVMDVLDEPTDIGATVIRVHPLFLMAPKTMGTGAT